MDILALATRKIDRFGQVLPMREPAGQMKPSEGPHSSGVRDSFERTKAQLVAWYPRT